MTPAEVEANGLRFALFDEGTGPLVLLLHGFPDTPHTWDALRPALVAAGYRVVTPFLRGYAPSGLPDRPPTAEDLGRDVLALITACGAERAEVVGHDWGAVAAYAAAALDPGRLTGLFAVAVPHPRALPPHPRMLWHWRHFFALNLPGAARRLRRRDFAYVATLYRRWSPSWRFTEADLAPVRACLGPPGSAEAAVSYYRMLRRPPLALLRRPIPVPTRAVAGLDDAAVHPAHFEAARAAFTGPYDVVCLPGGHFVHRESPDAFRDTLLAWLDRA